METLRAYAQLFRVPNVFTAMADIGVGLLIVLGNGSGVSRADWLTGVSKLNQGDFYAVMLGLLGASSCLYLAGMALNDFFDVDQDRRERPSRPIPSGRVSRRIAGLLGFILLAVGPALALLCRSSLGYQPFLISLSLGIAVLGYDGWLKRTPFGPLAMGLCRFLNVLLGFSASGDLPQLWMIHIAAIVGIYVVGVTWFAAKEAGRSRRSALVSAAMVMLSAIGLLAFLPTWFRGRELYGWWSPDLLFPVVTGLWLMILMIPVISAIHSPEPSRIQRAVKTCIMGLIGLDAVIACSVTGIAGLLILCLLFPALKLGRWVYST